MGQNFHICLRSGATGLTPLWDNGWLQVVQGGCGDYRWLLVFKGDYRWLLYKADNFWGRNRNSVFRSLAVAGTKDQGIFCEEVKSGNDIAPKA